MKKVEEATCDKRESILPEDFDLLWDRLNRGFIQSKITDYQVKRILDSFLEDKSNVIVNDLHESASRQRGRTMQKAM